MDISPKQMVGVSAGLIPFLEHDDANRALMGSNMQRQAVPLLIAEPPIVATGLEQRRRDELGHDRQGPAGRHRHLRRLDAGRSSTTTSIYKLRKYVGLNERTCLNQKPVVEVGQKVKKGDILADGAADLPGRARPGPQRPGRLHGLGRLQLRGRDHHQRTPREGRRLHVDPHRGVRDRDPRDEARPRGVHPRHPQRLGEGAAEPRRERDRPDRHLRQAGRHPGRQGRAEVQERADPRGEAAARDLRPRRRGRQERLARGPLGRRGDRHQHPAVQPPDEPQRGGAQGLREGAEGHRAARERQDRRRIQADDQGARGGRRRAGARPRQRQAPGPRQGPQGPGRRERAVQARGARPPQPRHARRRPARSSASTPPGSRRSATRRTAASTA